MKKTFILFLLLFLSEAMLFSQNPKLVKDFNTGTGDAVPSWGTTFGAIGSLIYFTVSTEGNKTDLYSVVNESTKFIKTICTDCNPPATQIADYKGNILFTVSENSAYSLWMSNGTDSNPTKLIELSGSASFMVVGNNNKAYIASGGNLYVTDGTEAGTKKLNTSYLDYASHKDNKDDKIFTPYKNGIAFLTNKFGNANLMYAEDQITSLAEFDAGSSFTDLFGLCEVAGGLVFGMESNGLYHYHESTGVKKTQLEEPLRLLDFNGSAVHYHYGKGLTLLHDNPLKSTPLVNKYGPVIQTEELNRAIIGDKFIVHIDDYNSFKDLIISIDKSSKTAKILGQVESYPSNFVTYNENMFFFDGTSNGFRPSLYHLKDDFSDLGDPKIEMSFNSTNGPSAIPIGMNNNNLYFFSNLDASKGRELYKIAVDINTSVEDVSLKTEFDFTVVNNTLTITGKEEYQKFEVVIIDTAGKVLDTQWVNAGVATTLPGFNQPVIILAVEKESKKSLAKKIFMP